MMPELSQREKSLEWACRILISLDLVLVMSGPIIFFQSKYVLESPLIPRSLMYDIVKTDMITSLVVGVGLMAGLWLHFFKQRIGTIICLSIAAAYFWSNHLF